MDSTKEYSSNVVRVLHPTNNNWDDQQQQQQKHYESKSTRNILDSSDHKLASTNFIRQAQSNYSTRSNYSTKSNREYIDDGGLLQSSQQQQQQYHNQPQNRQQKITTTTKNYTTTTNNNNTPGNGNVEYLDELLDDLKHERTATTANINNDLNEYNTTSSYKYNSSSNIPDKRTEYLDTKIHRTTGVGSNNVIRQHHNDIYNTTKSVSSGNLIEHNPHTGTTIKRSEHIEVLPSQHHHHHHHHGDDDHQRSTIQRTKHVEILNSKNLETIPIIRPHISNSSSETTTTLKRDVLQNHPSDLKEIPLDPSLTEDLLPLPGTKVTTTVRTYTYEVPSVITRTNVLYHDDVRNDVGIPLNTSTINKNYSEKITNINDNYSTTTTDRRIVNGNLPSPNDITPVNTLPHVHEPLDSGPGPGPKRTYYYKHEVHNTKNTINQPPPPQPYINEYHITKNTSNTTTNRYPPNDPPPSSILRPISPESISPVPPPSVTHHTYITKTTTTNNDYPDGPRPRDLSPYDGPGGPPYDRSPRPHSPGVGPITQTYIRSHEKTTNSTRPFPVNDTLGYPDDGTVQPPKKLDELMASFDKNGDGDDLDNLRRKREVDTSVANTDNKVRVPSRNQSGPPVFYPPNSELTLRQKEGGGGAWRAQGGYAAGASGYEYQAESSSKSKSKSGAAVVPVCLPLCCAMPCVLM